MISTEITFSVEKRDNRFAKTNKEWALNASLGGRDAWTLKAWGHKPTSKEVEEAKRIILRAFEVYHAHLRIPPFHMKVIK